MFPDQVAVTPMSGASNAGAMPAWLALRSPGYVLQEQLELALRLRDNSFDLVHLTANTAPLIRLRWPPTVVTVHDVMYLMNPTEFALSPSARQNLGRIYRWLAFHSGTTNVDRLIVDSEHTLRQLAKRVKHFPPVSIVYPGVDDRFFDKKVEDRLSVKYPLTAGRYFLHPGANDPRKNTGVVLSAFERYRARGGRVELAVVGLTKAHLAKLQRAPQAGVHLMPFVSNDDLLMLLKLARGLIYVPSEEGFGYPLVEAMAAGVPAIISSIPVLEEMSAGCAWTVRPGDADALANGLLEFDADDGRSSDLAARGEVRSQLFTTRRMAEETLRAYQETLATTSV
jgi:glycosyltransferase involved in cell wall biosynthesis